MMPAGLRNKPQRHHATGLDFFLFLSADESFISIQKSRPQASSSSQVGQCDAAALLMGAAPTCVPDLFACYQPTSAFLWMDVA